MSEPIFTLTINIKESYGLKSGGKSVNMVVFSAKAEGRLFNGETVTDGTDTQISDDGSFTLSARYMLEGKDTEGKACRLYIENNGSSLDNCKPKIITDSPALKGLELFPVYAKGEATDNGVIIRFYIESSDRRFA